MNDATNIDPINLLTLERTFCVYCFQMGLRPEGHPSGILGGVRFGRKPTMTATEAYHYRIKARGRVMAHLVAEHYGIALHLFPRYAEAHQPSQPVEA